ncbi:MAG: apolipoprotein N-acyltransferase [Leptospirales bacterium]|nr:apolipoprotein N-acyltransferase [Leptospirales bacterium]
MQTRDKEKQARTQIIRRLACCLGLGLGVLLGLDPFKSILAGTLAAISLILLSEELRGESYNSIAIWSTLASLSVGAFAFQWVAVALANITQLPWVIAILSAALHSVLLNLKIPLFLFGAHALRARGALDSAGFGYALLALLGDLATYQIFPWFFGNLQGGNILLIQAARIAGVYGVSFLLFLQAALLLFFARRMQAKLRKEKPEPVSQSVGALAAILLFAYGYGVYRLTTPVESGRSVHIAYIQPATQMALSKYKDDNAAASAALNEVFNLSLKSLGDAGGEADLLILPESSIPFLGTDPSDENRAKGVYSTTFHAVIAFLSRAASVDVLYNELNFREGKLYNQATVFGREGQRRGSYDKQQLVPFGEHLPLEEWLPIRKLFPEASNYAQGKSPGLLEYRKRLARARLQPISPADLDRLRDANLVLANWPAEPPGESGYLTPLVCYEGMFPELVRRSMLLPTEPDFHVNIANDSWFGDYLENAQHSGAVRFRSIETGKHLVRITLTGVSTVFTPWGMNLIPESKPGEKAVGNVVIPLQSPHRTPYVNFGNVPNWMLVGFGLLALILPVYRKKVTPAPSKRRA